MALVEADVVAAGDGIGQEALGHDVAALVGVAIGHQGRELGNAQHLQAQLIELGGGVARLGREPVAAGAAALLGGTQAQGRLPSHQGGSDVAAGQVDQGQFTLFVYALGLHQQVALAGLAGNVAAGEGGNLGQIPGARAGAIEHGEHGLHQAMHTALGVQQPQVAAPALHGQANGVFQGGDVGQGGGLHGVHGKACLGTVAGGLGQGVGAQARLCQAAGHGLKKPFLGGFGDKFMRVGGHGVLHAYVVRAGGVEAGLGWPQGGKFARIEHHGRAVQGDQLCQSAGLGGLQAQMVVAQIGAIGRGCLLGFKAIRVGPGHQQQVDVPEHGAQQAAFIQLLQQGQNGFGRCRGIALLACHDHDHGALRGIQAAGGEVCALGGQDGRNRPAIL